MDGCATLVPRPIPIVEMGGIDLVLTTNGVAGQFLPYRFHLGEGGRPWITLSEEIRLDLR